MRLHKRDGRFEIEPSTSAEYERLAALVDTNVSVEPRDAQPTIRSRPSDPVQNTDQKE